MRRTQARCVGHGKKAAVCQFIKGTWECGERNLLQGAGVEFAVMNTGFTWDTQNKEADTAAAQATWQESKRMLSDSSIDVVLLDELTSQQALTAQKTVKERTTKASLVVSALVIS